MAKRPIVTLTVLFKAIATWLLTMEIRGNMNYITVLMSSFIAAEGRIFAFFLFAENMSKPLELVKMDSQEILTEWMLDTGYIQR